MIKVRGCKIAAVLTSVISLGSVALAAEAGPGTGVADLGSVYKTVGLGAAAAFAVAVSILGAGYAVGRIGSAALGAAAEKP